MKNIFKYRTPQEKMIAWKRWCYGDVGCRVCAMKGYTKDCNPTNCFNAWLHSTTEDKK